MDTRHSIEQTVFMRREDGYAAEIEPEVVFGTRLFLQQNSNSAAVKGSQNRFNAKDVDGKDRYNTVGVLLPVFKDHHYSSCEISILQELPLKPPFAGLWHARCHSRITRLTS